MAEKIDEMEFETTLSLADIEKRLGRALSKIGTENRDFISGSTADIAMQVSGKTAPLSPFIFCIEIYVRDLGKAREVTLNALGSGLGSYFATSLMQQRGSHIDFKKSMKKRDILYKVINA